MDKRRFLAARFIVALEIFSLGLGNGQAFAAAPRAQTGANATSVNNQAQAAQSTAAPSAGSRMKGITNKQRQNAAAQAAINRGALRQGAKAASKTRMAQPVNAATLNPVTAPAGVVAPAAAAPAAVVNAPLSTAAVTASTAPAALTTTVLAGAFMNPVTKAPIMNGNVPVGIPGAGVSSTGAYANVCQPGVLDYFNCGNYANSPLPETDSAGSIVPGTGIRKFVDTLAGVGAANANKLGNYIPIATPDTAKYPGSDYYQIELKRYTQQMHSDLPSTLLQGYRDAAGADNSSHYLGPIIFAQKDRPVRVKFTNSLPANADGKLFLPVDKTMKGAGTGPDGSPYTENRALLHLHGGITPWISDGTPHQWITPAGDGTTLKKGASQYNVPDMPQPAADGSSGWDTWYWTNEQSSRMLWYHDHSYASTRLNVYAGEAAPYILSDSWEEDLISGNNVTGNNPNGFKLPDQSGLDKSGQGVYRHGIPLVIQDKTFVPPTADKSGKLPGNYTLDQLMAEDPTWFQAIQTTGSLNSAIWGQFGQLWFPHVFMPNQNPNDPASVVNGYGRWDYGAWVWPPVANLTHPAITSVDPVYNTSITIPPFPNPSAVQESFMDTPVVNGTAYPTLTVGQKAYRFRILNAANERHWNLQFYYAVDAQGSVCKPNTPNASTSGPAGCTEVKMIPAVPTAGAPSTWPNDGRPGGVPDWTLSGPDIIQIGTDSGFLPAPVDIPSQPVNYEYNRRVITTLNVSDHALLLGPAERADIVVDFSNVPDGAVLIMYNDAPAPDPGFDSRLDYYTGDLDQTNSGGAPTTLPGYGPNTRTVMQFVVSGAVDACSSQTGCGFDMNAFAQAIQGSNGHKGVYAAEQKAPLVPETAYGNSSDIYAKIQDTTYDTTTQQFVPQGGAAAGDIVMDMKPKAIAEEFDTDWGRMTAQLGVELPFTNFLTQTTLQMWMYDPPTEIANDNEVQIWKVTHNGVDTHSVHFHMFDVQLINRVAWDGTMYPPDANEVGWKETVRMNPLTDTIIALRPIKPTLPFPLPDSFRPLDPTAPVGSATPAFTNIDPMTNNPITVSNQLTNFGWEYVWHCHLLGHEENDMMRPVVVKVAPEAPGIGTATRNSADNSVTLTWTNNAASATGFDIQRAQDPGFTTDLQTFHIAPTVTATSQLAPGTAGSYTDKTAQANLKYYYQVAATKLFNNPVIETPATNTLYSAWSGSAAAPAVPAPVASVVPLSLTFGTTPLRTHSAAQAVTVSNIGNSALTISNVAITGDFAQTNNCSSVVAGANCTINVTFTPTAASAQGGRTGTLTFTTNDMQHKSFTIALSGTGTALSVNPTALIFGVGTRLAQTQTVTLQNLGATPINVTGTGISIAASSANPGDFSVSNNCGARIAANRSCTVTVRFAPIATGIRTASIGISTSDPAGPQSVGLTGGANPAITLSPATLPFNSVNLNTPSAQAITVTSTGNWPVNVTGVGLSGINSNQFAQTNNCLAALGTGATCTVNVTFTPTSAGTKTASLTVNVGAPGVSQSVALSGTGINPNPAISVTPVSTAANPYNLGTLLRNTTATATFKVTNSGTGAVTIPSAGVALAAGSSAQFSVTGNTCAGVTLANAQSSCTISVTFKAPRLATVNGQVVITPAAPATPQTIYVRGTGL